MKIGFTPLALSVLMLALYGCGGGSGSSAGRGGVMDGELTIKITDAPVDTATAVWLQFSGVTVKPKDGSAFDIIFDAPLKINLLALQAGKTAILLDNVRVPVATYNWIRLHVNAVRDGNLDTDLDSYIVLDDGSEHELSIPAGAQIGLQIINDIDVGSNADVNLLIDFDLRQSIVVMGNGNYALSPVLRMVDMDKTGDLTGIIDASLLASADCSDADPLTGNAVYVFAGENARPDDIDGGNDDPVATANVVFNIETGNYEYTVSYLEVGDYTMAFTCQADFDQPDSNQQNFIFSTTENVEIEKEDEMISVSR